MWADGLRRRGIDPRQDGARRPGTELAFPLVRFSIGTHGRDPSIGSWVRLLVGLAPSGHQFYDRGPSQPQTHQRRSRPEPRGISAFESRAARARQCADEAVPWRARALMLRRGLYLRRTVPAGRGVEACRRAEYSLPLGGGSRDRRLSVSSAGGSRKAPPCQIEPSFRSPVAGQASPERSAREARGGVGRARGRASAGRA